MALLGKTTMTKQTTQKLADIERYCWIRYHRAKQVKYRKIWLRRCATVGAKLRNWPDKLDDSSNGFPICQLEFVED